MGGCIRKLRWFLLLLLSAAFLSAQEDLALKFLKGPERPVVSNVHENIVSVTLLDDEIEATLISFGKAHPLSVELLDKLKAKDRQIHNQAKKIRTAFNIEQGNNRFYLRGFASIRLSELPAGKPVKCRIVLIVVRTKDAVSYLPLIRTIQLL
jgi:hypothetical protein